MTAGPSDWRPGSMSDRQGEIERFLSRAGYGAGRRSMLAGDASFRRYERLDLGGTSVVLMDAPPPETVRPFVAVAGVLRGLGFSAPATLAADAQKGLLLLEDLGDLTYTRILDGSPAAEGAPDEAALYALAVDVLIDLHRRPLSSFAAADLAPYDDARLLDEALLLTDWYLPALRGVPIPAAERAAYVDLWRTVLPLARGVADTLVLRDYHVDNLMWLRGRAGLAACGLLDFQDAVIGPVTYDLVSLLEDARRDIAPALAASMQARYLAAFPALDRAAFAASAAVLAAQRNCKIIGIFTRLWRRDGKTQYLRHIPRVFGLLERDVAHPALAPLADWLDRAVPPPLRRRVFEPAS